MFAAAQQIASVAGLKATKVQVRTAALFFFSLLRLSFFLSDHDRSALEESAFDVARIFRI